MRAITVDRMARRWLRHTVIDALTAAAAAADARYIAYLRSLQPEEAARIVQAEIASEKAVGTDGPFLLLTY
jgi:hypothetical protein